MEGSFIIVGPEGASEGTEMTIAFTGAFDTATGASSFTMNLGDAIAGFPGGEEIPPELEGLIGDMEVRTIGDTAYMRFPFFSSMLGVDTEWISLPAEDAGSATSTFGPSPGNPADLLSAFGGVDADLEEVGREQVRGVDTTHFRFKADIEAMMAAADEDAQAQLDELGARGGELPIDFWIGDDGLVHKFSFSVDGAAAGAESGFEAMTMIWEMFDYGADVGIVAPPADQVSDGSSLSGVFGS
jgi:hypothetical protein